MVLSSSVDSQISANKLVERKAKELEKVKGEMELRLFEMEEENIKLTECVNDLENQLSRNGARECEYVKTEKQKLQESAENLIEECNALQKSYEDMTKGKADLYDQCSRLEIELMEARRDIVYPELNSIEESFQTVREESELNIQNLTTELATIKQNHKKLTVDYEKKSKLLNGYRTREERRKTMAELLLELKLTVSEYERQQLIQEAASLKDKMHKTLNLENEVFDYKRKLDKLKGEKSNLEASLRLVSSSNEELQAEKISFAKKMSEIKSANLKHQLKIQQLEGEKNECLKKMEDLKLQLAKKLGGWHLSSTKKYRLQLQRLKPEGRNSLSSAPGKPKAENEAVTKDRFERTKSSLETELKDLRDRYLEMSLKYAEVEAEREDLVMQSMNHQPTPGNQHHSGSKNREGQSVIKGYISALKTDWLCKDQAGYELIKPRLLDFNDEVSDEDEIVIVKKNKEKETPADDDLSKPFKAASNAHPKNHQFHSTQPQNAHKCKNIRWDERSQPDHITRFTGMGNHSSMAYVVLACRMFQQTLDGQGI
ncbi:hypothetical protein Tco_1228104 [Tanacetum coccineum]